MIHTRIKKFNGGYGAILCNSCAVIIKQGFRKAGPEGITPADWNTNEPIRCEKCERLNKPFKY